MPLRRDPGQRPSERYSCKGTTTHKKSAHTRVGPGQRSQKSFIQLHRRRDPDISENRTGLKLQFCHFPALSTCGPPCFTESHSIQLRSENFIRSRWRDIDVGLPRESKEVMLPCWTACVLLGANGLQFGDLQCSRQERPARRSWPPNSAKS